MRPKSLLPSLLLVLLVTPNASSTQSLENATTGREEYAVYSTIIVDYAREETGTLIILNPTSHVIRGETKLKDFQFYHYPDPAPMLLQETLDDFLLRNKSNRWLTPKLEISRKYVLVDGREVVALINDRDISATNYGWKPFFTRYPSSRGYITLSRVGFNRQMDQALVHVGWRCPALCGQWSFIMLLKKEGRWTVVGEANRIVS